MNKEERLVADFFNKKGLQAKEFTKAEKGRAKTPDFRVFKNNELAFFCEVKTVSYDPWIDNKIREAPTETIVSVWRKEPVFNRLSNKIHEAVQQFDAVNPDLGYPNVLAFVNYDRYDVTYLHNVITGCFLAEDGSRESIYRQFSEGRIKDERSRIHLYLWYNFTNNSWKEYHCFNLLPQEKLAALCNYFSINPNDINKI